MNKETRIQRIAEILERKDSSHGGIEIPWEDALVLMPVYKIPLNYLIFNKYNGRILSRTKSLEKQGRQILPDTDEGEKTIADLLWHSDAKRNAQTLTSLKAIGQEKVGIITRDGIIIDGNRRAMLLKRSGQFEYFKTVVLDVTLEENPNEIEKLETTYQMGEDEKLSYNATEKYLKAKFLSKKGVPTETIAKWMGETKSTIEDLLKIMETMDDYLDYIGCNGIYTQLDGREDHFITLTKQISQFRGEESQKAFDGYKEDDVDDLKLISYDYIRVKYEGKAFRNIATGLRGSHFFGDKRIWESFRDFHFSNIGPIRDAEGKIDFSSQNLTAYLNDRDEKFFDKCKNGNGKSYFDENIEAHWQQLQYRKAHNEPAKLVTSAIDALGAIDQRHKAFSAPDVMEKVEKINALVTTMLNGNAPDRLLGQALHLLSSIKLDEAKEVKEDLLLKIKEIEKISYRLEKEIKDL